MSALPVSPFDESRYIGTVCFVRPSTVDINLPKAASASSSHFAGFPIHAGQVGEFVVIESDEHAVLGRIVEVRLPERERLTVEPTAASEGDVNPVGTVQLLTSIDLASGITLKGIPAHPRISQHVFSAHPLLVKQAVEGQPDAEAKRVQLAVFPQAQGTPVSLPPSSIFGRHCAVLGATGGGKSWTLAKLLEEILRLQGKAILFDATGEFRTQAGAVTHVYLGGRKTGDDDERTFVSFPYQYLTETDLFVLFRPSAGAQAPRLREAVRSLKLAHLQPDLAVDGLVKKAGQARGAFEEAMRLHEGELLKLAANYDITKLGQQVFEECVFPTGRQGQEGTHWGGAANQDQAFCTSLVSRIDAEVASDSMACVFKHDDLTSLPRVIRAFVQDPAKSLLRISLEHMPFEHNTRELVTNAIGRFLLREARAGRFAKRPLVVALDEAHQFLDKAVGDEANKTSLDSFGLIAKEGRKYGLTCVLATQRPRDIPEDVLSQMGMFIVHRLINDRDRNVVERACGNLDHAAASFLPTLGQGEAIVVGVDSPMPLPLKIKLPMNPPESKGPDYGAHWGAVEAEVDMGAVAQQAGVPTA